MITFKGFRREDLDSEGSDPLVWFSAETQDEFLELCEQFPRTPLVCAVGELELESKPVPEQILFDL